MSNLKRDTLGSVVSNHSLRFNTDVRAPPTSTDRTDPTNPPRPSPWMESSTSEMYYPTTRPVSSGL